MALLPGAPIPLHLNYERLGDGCTLPNYLGFIEVTPTDDQQVYTLPLTRLSPGPIEPGVFLYVRNASDFSATLAVQDPDVLAGSPQIPAQSTVQVTHDGNGTWVVLTPGEAAPVQATWNVPADFANPQAALDTLVGRPINNVVINVTSTPGVLSVYTQGLDMTGIVSQPSQDQALPVEQVPIPNYQATPLPGLTLVGDPRYCAGMQYVNGAQLSYFNMLNGGGYQQKLGTPYGRVSLEHPAVNQIRVSITSAPDTNPETGEAGVVEHPDFNDPLINVTSGDLIKIADASGTWSEVNVVAASSHTITYTGPDIAAYSALIICPRVQLEAPSGQDWASFLLSGATLQGFWLRGNINLRSYNVLAKGQVKLLNCLVEDPNLLTGVNLTPEGVVSATDANNNYHLTLLGSHVGLTLTEGGQAMGGHLWVSSAAQQNVSCEDATVKSRLSSLLSIWSGGAGVLGTGAGLLGLQYYLGAYDNQPGLLLMDGAQVTLENDNLEVDNTHTTQSGVVLESGAKLVTGPVAVYNSVIRNCETGLSGSNGAQINLTNDEPLLIQGGTVGVVLTGGSQLTANYDISYLGLSLTNFHLIDADSRYVISNNSEAQSGVLRVLEAGVLDSTYLTQFLSGSGGFALTINSNSSYNGLFYYWGKTFKLTSDAIHAYTLTSSTANIIGTGSPSYATVMHWAGVNLGESVTFTVIPGGAIAVLSANGVTFT